MYTVAVVRANRRLIHHHYTATNHLDQTPYVAIIIIIIIIIHHSSRFHFWSELTYFVPSDAYTRGNYSRLKAMSDFELGQRTFFSIFAMKEKSCHAFYFQERVAVLYDNHWLNQMSLKTFPTCIEGDIFFVLLAFVYWMCYFSSPLLHWNWLLNLDIMEREDSDGVKYCCMRSLSSMFLQNSNLQFDW